MANDRVLDRQMSPNPTGGHPQVDWPLKLSGKSLAALGAAAADNFLSTSRQHALAETVAALADKSAWLIRAFHDKFSVYPNPTAASCGFGKIQLISVR